MSGASNSTTPALIWVLWRRISVRHWRQAPLQSGLLLIILAFGIAVFFSIRLANRAAVDSFQNFTDLLSEESDFMITAPAGALDEKVLPRLREVLGQLDVRLVAVVESTGAVPEQGTREQIGAGETYSLVGIDSIAALSWNERVGNGDHWFASNPSQPGDADFWTRWRDPHSVFVSEALMRSGKRKVGDLFPLVVQDQIVQLRIAGVIPSRRDGPNIPSSLLVMDLPALQQISGKNGRIDRVELRIEPSSSAKLIRAEVGELLKANAGGEWVVGVPSDRRASAEMMTRAFRFNLTLLSFIALLVGLYLIYQALDGAVLRRREEMAILRSLGVEPRTLAHLWLMEAAMLGAAGGVLGLGLGWLGAQISVRVIGRTVNALYYATSVNQVRLDLGEVLLAMALSIGASLMAGWIPSRVASMTPPAQFLGRTKVFAVPGQLSRSFWSVIVWLLLGLGFCRLPPVRWEGETRFPLAGYAAALCWVVAGSLVAGRLLPTLARGLAVAGVWSASIRIGLSHLAQSSSRHRIAAGSLVCAVAMTGGMAILVDSFDATMRGWIERTFQADLYVSSDGAQSASSQNRISFETWQKVITKPAVLEANPVQVLEIPLGVAKTLLVGSDLGFVHRHTQMAWVEPPLNDAVFLSPPDHESNVPLCLVSESFSERFQRRRGESVELPFPSGPRRFIIAGVFSEYGNERGSVWISRNILEDGFRDKSVANLILFLKPGYSPEDFRLQLRAQYPGLAAFTQSHLRKEILRIFHQTFAITYALEMIGVIVAVAGLAVTMASILLERGAEFATLRALGMTRHEMAFNSAWEGGLVAAPGVIVGVLLSLGLGWILIFIVNKQTFGWTLQYQIPIGQLGLLGAAVLTVSMGVSYGVGRWGARLPADREE